MTNYTKQDYERDLQIVADAPDSAKYVDTELCYVKFVNGNYHYAVSKFGSWRPMDRVDFSLTRSLQDIRDKIAMYEANQRLIQKDAEHKAEIDELKAEHYKSICNWRKSFDSMHQRAMRSEQSLAQHDKQVKIDALEGLRSEFNAEKDYWGNNPMAHIEDLDEYINQIKEQ